MSCVSLLPQKLSYSSWSPRAGRTPSLGKGSSRISLWPCLNLRAGSVPAGVGPGRNDKCRTQRWLVTPKTGVPPQAIPVPERRLERPWGASGRQQGCKGPTYQGPEGLKEEFRLGAGGDDVG